MLRIISSSKKLSDIHADITIIPVDDSMGIESIYSPEVTNGLFALIKTSSFKGQWGRAELFVAPKGISSSFVAFAGMGEKNLSLARKQEALRRAVAAIVLDGRMHMAKHLAIRVSDISHIAPICEALLFTNYWFAEYSKALTQEKNTRALEVATLCMDASFASEGKRSIARAQAIMKGVTFTRDLVNQPASHMSPRVLVEEARKIAKSNSRISLTVMDRKKAQQKNFTAFLAVARGSKEEPYAIHLTYKPKKKSKKKVVLIGKAITFDSGGLSLKPARSMENMKIDMAGAATVLGVFSLLPMLDPDVEMHGLLFACENMPSGDAYRPGDVIPTMNGKTIEVLDTDAEGRVTLADALSYAGTLKPDAIIDLATLTGACVVAVGDTYAGLFGNNEALSKQVMDAARDAGEGVVEFPLPAEYVPTIQSRVADVRNISMMRMGGAITAALFLQEFVEKGTPWVHMDIAGPVYAEMPLIPYWQFGATGYGVRTLVNVIEAL